MYLLILGHKSITPTCAVDLGAITAKVHAREPHTTAVSRAAEALATTHEAFSSVSRLEIDWDLFESSWKTSLGPARLASFVGQVGPASEPYAFSGRFLHVSRTRLVWTENLFFLMVFISWYRRYACS